MQRCFSCMACLQVLGSTPSVHSCVTVTSCAFPIRSFPREVPDSGTKLAFVSPTASFVWLMSEIVTIVKVTLDRHCSVREHVWNGLKFKLQHRENCFLFWQPSQCAPGSGPTEIFPNNCLGRGFKHVSPLPYLDTLLLLTIFSTGWFHHLDYLHKQPSILCQHVGITSTPFYILYTSRTEHEIGDFCG